MSWAYYNEFDPYAAEWLRELIKVDLIAAGEVDERSIEDICPTELRGYSQCHFFAGIGVWSYALRRAGWPDDRPVWTGSCPCQPFSAAGKGGGFADERHLWPAFHHLIRHNRPDTVMGEQVAGKDGLAWLDLVYADMEADGYTFGALDLCAAGFGAPHIRQRLYWRADVGNDPRDQHAGGDERSEGGIPGASDGGQDEDAAAVGRENPNELGSRCPPVFGSADAKQFRRDGIGGVEPRGAEEERGMLESQRHDPAFRRFWTNAEWLLCRDGKYRPVEPVLQPVADGLADRLGVRRVASFGNPGGAEVIFPLIENAEAGPARLKGYGNALVAECAIAFIEATEGK